MKYGKRQLILASLVLALGAAVYLNWQFAGTKVQSAGDVSEESASSALGAAQLVNNAYVETVSDTLTKAARQKKQRLRYRLPQSFRTPA